jgi:CheY-like chemotaxis protein
MWRSQRSILLALDQLNDADHLLVYQLGLEKKLAPTESYLSNLHFKKCLFFIFATRFPISFKQPSRMKNLSIFLIDDSPEERKLFGETLNLIDESLNYQYASDGPAALHYLENTAILPDYIFLDVNMPGMDGLECLGRIKKITKAKNIPVIMYSTAHPSTYQTMAFALGATKCIAKTASIFDSCNYIASIIQSQETSL